MKKFILCLLTAIVSVSAWSKEVNVLRQPNNGSSRPFLEAVLEVFPQEASKKGIKDLEIKLHDFTVAADANTLMMSGKIDIMPTGTNAFGPVLSKLGPDKIKVLTGFSSFGYKLVCSDPTIKSVKDFKPDTKVAFKSLMAAEHYYLKSVANRDLGSYDALDKNVLILPRPQIQQLIEAGDKTVSCAIVGTPMQDSLIASKKAHAIDISDQKITMGPSLHSYAMTSWIEQNPLLAEAWISSVKQAHINFYKNPKKYIAIWKEKDQVKDSVDALYQQMIDGGVVYDYRPTTVVPYLNLMIDIGVIKSKKYTIEELSWKYNLIK